MTSPAVATTSTAPVSDFRSPPDALETFTPGKRVATTHAPSTKFTIPERTYQQQYSDMYFVRLTKLKPVVDKLAAEAWRDQMICGHMPRKIDRVLDVRQGVWCWISGTVYIDMPLKPNILEDISRDHFIVPPPPREKYTDTANDRVMLEDESGRLTLTGSELEKYGLVTGCVISVLGSENSEGAFEVWDVRLPEMPEQPSRGKSSDDPRPKKVAIVSGLGICGTVHENLETHLLIEYLLGEAGGEEDHNDVSKIGRLIIAGDSLGDTIAPLAERAGETKKARQKKYGYDAAAYNPAPTHFLDSLLATILPSLPITILPGPADPANISLPQQALHTAIFPTAKVYDGTMLDRGTNPWAGEIDGIKFLGSSGQNLDDVFKYVEGDDRVTMCQRMLEWRIIAPTAPDTLWSYPFQDTDPFLLGPKDCPHVYFVGNQPRFETSRVRGADGQIVTIILVPRFDVTAQMVELDLDTMETRVVSFKVDGEKAESFDVAMEE